MKIKELKNKKIAILGYWVEGKSTHNFLNKLEIKDITVLDKSNNLGYLDNLEEFDVIFKSPWISPYNNPELLKVSEKLTSQAEVFADNFEWKIIWITWTKGKSTISTLLYETLKELQYNVKLVWNIWNPVLDEIDIISWEKYDFVVYELSSYMLEWLDLNIFIWLLNNIYDCHLDWHNWRKNYEHAKFNVFKNAKYKLAWFELSPINIEWVEYFWLDWKYNFKNNFFNIWKNKILEDENIALNWEHNRKNIAGIIWILDKIWKKCPLLTKEGLGVVKKVLSEFTWLAHRQENIWTYKWITFINDAIASTPESAIAAIKTFGEKIWTIFIWNEDSGFNLDELRQTLIKYNIKNIVLFPETGEKIFWDFSKNMEYDIEVLYEEWDFETKLFKTLSMEEAVKFSFKNSTNWEIVLLSTWAPSFNVNWSWKMPWKWFIEKGSLFKKYVEKYGE